MAEVTMPKMGDAMEEGTLLQWLKKVGEHVDEQEPIAEIETEKATIEIPAYEAGVLKEILIPEGQTVAVGTPIARIQGEGEPEPAPRPAPEPEQAAGGQTRAAPQAEAPPVEEAPRADREQQPGTTTPAPPPGEHAPSGATDLEGGPAPRTRGGVSGPRPQPPARPRPQPESPEQEEDGRVKASPLARKIAAERGIDLRQVQGSGPGGRIVEADLEDTPASRPGAAEARPSAPRPAAPERDPAESAQTEFEERELSSMRRTIARRLLESKQTIPHYYVTSEIDMKAAAAWREQANAADPERAKISINDLIVRACALALRKFPAVNSQLVENKLRIAREIHVGVAVAMPEGLIVPVVRSADQKSVTQIAAEVRDLAERAHAGQLKPQEFSGGTFTISNLGMFDVESFCAIINPPEAAILAVGKAAEAPIVQDGKVVPGLRMKVTLSADHRIVDGAVAAQFLQEVKRLLQNPMLLV